MTGAPPETKELDLDALVRDTAREAGLAERRVARLVVDWHGEIVKARMEEVLVDDAERQRGRIQRTQVAWEGPDVWQEMTADDAIPDDLPLDPMPLPEGYRGAASIAQLPDAVQARLRPTLDEWARNSGGVAPPHKVKAWRLEVVHAFSAPFHLFVGVKRRELLLGVEQRTAKKVARGFALTALSGAGLGGFGLLLGPWVGMASFFFGSAIAATQVQSGLRKRYRLIYSA